MTSTFVYELARVGFVLIRKFLEENLVRDLLAVVDGLEPHFLGLKDAQPLVQGRNGFTHYLDLKTAASISHFSNPGLNLVIDDFLSAAPVFSKLVNHAPTMEIVAALALPPVTITSAELRYRYKNSMTGSHMGGPIDGRSAFRYVGSHMKDSGGGGLKMREIDLVNVRVVYAFTRSHSRTGRCRWFPERTRVISLARIRAMTHTSNPAWSGFKWKPETFSYSPKISVMAAFVIYSTRHAARSTSLIVRSGRARSVRRITTDRCDFGERRGMLLMPRNARCFRMHSSSIRRKVTRRWRSHDIWRNSCFGNTGTDPSPDPFCSWRARLFS